MLPRPSASFTLPSLYDDLELDCRLYFPRLIKGPENLHFIGFAVFAHPYAPLGGSYEDPVVHSVGSVLTKKGFVLATFNFRGAEQSAGKTSWSGKAELGDYVSLYALALSFLNVVGMSNYYPQEDAQQKSPVLLLGGYSYGSMIAAHLPCMATVLEITKHASIGTSEHEISGRARELGKAFLGHCEAQQHRGRSMQDAGTLSPERATFGGYESPTAARRISREGSRRSIDAERVRQSVDRMRRKLGSRQHSTDSSRERIKDKDEQEFQNIPRLVYLLISPVLGPVSSLATMFSKLKFERRDRTTTAARGSGATDIDEVLSQNTSLVVFGSQDNFTSPRKVRAWCESLAEKPGSCAQFQEVSDAGHFWHQTEIEKQMNTAVSDWLDALR